MLQRLHLPRFSTQPVAIRRYTVMIFIVLTAFGASDLLFNLYLTRLGYREDFIGLTNAVTQLVWAGAAATSGALAHRWSARRVLIIGTLILTAGYAARGVVNAPWAIVATFAVGCVGGGWVFAIGMAYIADYTRADNRLGAIALYSVASSLATTIGSLGGGYVPRLIGTLGGGQDAAEPLRITLLISAGAMLLGVIPLIGVGPPPPELSDPAVPLTGNGFTAIHARSSQRQIRRDVSVYLGFVFVLACGVAMVLPFYNVYLQRRGLSTGMIGTVFALGGIVGAAFGLLAPAFGARVGAARGAGLLRSCPGLLFLLLAFMAPAWLAAAAHVVRRGCFDASYALESSFASRLFPARIRAHVFAWREAVLSLGLALLSPIGGVLIVHFGYRAAFGVFFAISVVIAIIFLGYFARRERALPVVEQPPAREAVAAVG
jgi:MFS family permease